MATQFVDLIEEAEDQRQRLFVDRELCGADGWTLTPAGTRGVLNDAISIYFADATLAGAFVARWCVGSKVETAGGVFQVREDEPAPRVGARLHRTP
jgi:hypothetical protein